MVLLVLIAFSQGLSSLVLVVVVEPFSQGLSCLVVVVVVVVLLEWPFSQGLSSLIVVVVLVVVAPFSQGCSCLAFCLGLGPNSKPLVELLACWADRRTSGSFLVTLALSAANPFAAFFSCLAKLQQPLPAGLPLLFLFIPFYQGYGPKKKCTNHQVQHTLLARVRVEKKPGSLDSRKWLQ